jgi:hypothetical protein
MSNHETDTRPVINSVWSAYGHTFISEDGYESCLTCGAVYQLVATPDEMYDGEYVKANGEPADECSGDTSMEHGYESDSPCSCCACA